VSCWVGLKDFGDIMWIGDFSWWDELVDIDVVGWDVLVGYSGTFIGIWRTEGEIDPPIMVHCHHTIL